MPGSCSAGNSTSTTGPMTRTTRPVPALLASYPLAAIMITEHANAVAARKFSIRLRKLPGMTQKKRELAEQGDATIAKLTQFFMNPNPDTTWRELVYQWITEVQTTDAPALYVRRNARRDIAELRLIDGAMIA